MEACALGVMQPEVADTDAGEPLLRTPERPRVQSIALRPTYTPTRSAPRLRTWKWTVLCATPTSAAICFWRLPSESPSATAAAVDPARAHARLRRSARGRGLVRLRRLRRCQLVHL